MIRKSSKLILSAAFLMLLWATTAVLAISEGGAIFLLIRPGARPSGMGSAFAAIADDATATYFNPSGLAYLMPERVKYFAPEDIKDWPLLLSDLQDKDYNYLFRPEEVTDPGAMILRVRRSPLLSVWDVADRKPLAAALADSANNLPAHRMVISCLDSAARAKLAVLKGDSAAGRDLMAEVLYCLNRQMTAGDLYRTALADRISLPVDASDIVRYGKSLREKKSFIPADFMGPESLAASLVKAADPLSKYLWTKFSPAAKKALKKGLPADSVRTVLSGELNRMITGTIYRADRFKGLDLPTDLRDLAATNPQGDTLAEMNMRILEWAYPGEVSILIDYQRLGQENTQVLNRRIVEAYLPGVFAVLDRQGGRDTFSLYLKAKMEEATWDSLRIYSGLAPATPSESALLVDYLNSVINGFQSADAPAGRQVAVMRSNREEVEKRFAGMVRPYAEKTRVSAAARVRSLMDPSVLEVCDGFIAGSPVADADKIVVLAGLNKLLEDPKLYDPESFSKLGLDPVAKEYLLEGVDNLTPENIMALNRKLLEAVHPGAINRRVEKTSHYATLMHSPWLSDIWGDVGSDMYYEFIAYAQPVNDWGVFGGNVIFLSEGTNQRIDENNQVLGSFSSYEMAPTLTYANMLYDKLAAGINLKLIYSHLAPFAAPGQTGKGIATTWAIDFGLLYRGLVKGLSFGANVQNIGPDLTYVDAQESDPLSRNLRVGTAYNILDGRLSRFTAAWDVTKTIVNLPLPRPWREELEEVVHHVGLEYIYKGPASLSLRYGLVYDRIGHIGTGDDGNFSLNKASSFGAGVGFKKINFDFAMEPGGELQTRNKKFSLSAVF